MGRTGTKAGQRRRRRMLAGRRTTRRLRRGTEVLEFTLIVPFLLLFVMIAIDMGLQVFYGEILHDAVFVAARTGAQYGGGDINTVSRSTFFNAISALPGGDAQVTHFAVTQGGVCSNAGAATRYVTVTASLRSHYITPGFYEAMSLATGQGLNLTSTASARCEVSR